MGPLSASTMSPMLPTRFFTLTAVAIAAQAGAYAQTATPADAGQLLEQQRRLESPSLPFKPAEPPALPPRPPVAQPADGLAFGGIQTMLTQFAFTGNNQLPEADLQAVLTPWLNRPLGLADLRQAGNALETLYRDRGWLAKVTLPSQDVSDGRVRFDVLVAKRGSIRITSEGANKPGTPHLAKRIESLLDAAMPPDAPLSLLKFERALLIANDIPGMAVTGSLQAGDTPSNTDVLVLKVTEILAARAEISVDNAGSRSTGIDRLNAQLTLSSALGYGELVSISASKTTGSEYLRASASAPITFPGQDGWSGWRFGASTSALRFKVLDSQNTTTGLSPEGTSNTIGIDLQYPIIRTNLSNWQLTLGLEEKRLNNQDDNVTLNVLATTSAAHLQTFNLGFGGNTFDRWGGGGSTSANATYTNCNLKLDGSPTAQITSDRTTANTQGSFEKVRLSASRFQSLGLSLGQEYSLFASLSGQLAGGNLDPSEKFYLGGSSGVRAYPSGEAGGSTGQLVSLELRRQLGAQFQLSAFYDYGQVDQFKNNQRADGTGAMVVANGVALAGAGLALNWRATVGAQLKATWAQRIGTNPLATVTGNDTDGSLVKDRFWFSANLPF